MSIITTMPDHARVWIYQSTKELDPEEVNTIRKEADEFLNKWTSHEKKMNAKIEILDQLFLIAMVDENTAPASGCGIDKLVRFIQQIEQKHSLNLLSRTNVAYEQNNKIEQCSLSEFEEKLAERSITENTLVFNNMVSTVKELNSNWKVPIKMSWHSRMLKTTTQLSH